MFSGKRVLVTGATGFIGSHLVEYLLDAGADVRAMTHYRSDPSLHNLEFLSREKRESLEIVRGDIADGFFVNRAVEGCDYVFHLAALIAIPYSYVAPASYVSTNVTGTLNVLEACRSHGTPRLVHTSTSECYGTAQYTPIDEAHPLQGQSPYSASKIAADKLAESYYCSFDLPVVTIRPFNTFGPRQSTRAVIPTIISQLVAGKEEVCLGSLTPVRDFTYVTDTVRGFIQGAITPDVEGGVFNLGVGKGITIGDLAVKLVELAGSNAKVTCDGDRIRPDNSEVMALISDNAKSREQLGWSPEFSLTEGLTETIEFVRENLHLFDVQCYSV